MEKEELLDTLKEFFFDPSRPRQETRDGLEEAREEIDSMIEAMDED